MIRSRMSAENHGGNPDKAVAAAFRKAHRWTETTRELTQFRVTMR
jgi:hypothetical protein